MQRRCEAGNARSRNIFAGSEASGRATESCVVFEDAPAGIEAARRAGMACVVIASRLTGGQIGALADTRHVVHVVDDFTDPALSALFA